MKQFHPTNKRTLAILAFVASLLLGLSTASAQVTINLGSDGSYGAINIPASSGITTLNVPADGVFNCTSITVGRSSTLKFVKNALNTPVYLLASGDVLIEGVVDVSGENAAGVLGGAGGPGGFDGGNGGFTGGITAGDGHGPEGGVDTTANTADRAGGNSYMTPLLIPIIGGSGGSGGDNRLTPPASFGAGGGGGGAIVVASNTKIELACSGSIRANGGSRGSNAGTGARGAVRLIAPSINEVTCSTGAASSTSVVAGQIRVDAIDKTGIPAISLSSTLGTSIGTAMFVFPPTVPTLRLTTVAGNVVPPGADAFFVLPAGSPTNQNVVVEAMDFDGASLDIEVQVVPENGASSVVQATVNLAAGNPATVTVPVTIPVNTGTRICVWTRRP